ncbi:MAG: hypothetical protein BGO14_00025 [Chlamydiales bacterium 38-26]|nr:hypothetical protein [Chlamydiales bacterium]OJV07454.1 MAG: hypothetical protein BGO14_00025 [Chlamydiales bacterium 38-26]
MPTISGNNYHHDDLAPINKPEPQTTSPTKNDSEGSLISGRRISLVSQRVQMYETMTQKAQDALPKAPLKGKEFTPSQSPQNTASSEKINRLSKEIIPKTPSNQESAATHQLIDPEVRLGSYENDYDMEILDDWVAHFEETLDELKMDEDLPELDQESASFDQFVNELLAAPDIDEPATSNENVQSKEIKNEETPKQEPAKNISKQNKPSEPLIDERFKDFSALQKKLTKSNMKLVLNSKGETLAKRRFGIFKSGRSDKTQNALRDVLGKINTALVAGHKSFVDENNQVQDFQTLIDGFLNTKYAQNVMKNAPDIAMNVMGFYLKTLQENDTSKNLTEFNKHLTTFKDHFINISDKKNFEGEAALKFITTLQMSAKAAVAYKKNQEAENQVRADRKRESLDIIKNLESYTLPSDIRLNENENKKLNYNLNELIKTEDSFFSKISHLPQQFQTLLENNLLSQEEFNSYSAIINPLLSEAKALNTELQGLKGKELNEQIKTILELYSPSKIQTYLKTFMPYMRVYRQIEQKIDQIKKSDLNFYNTLGIPSSLTSLEDLAIEPVQRLPRHQMLLKEMIKNVNAEEAKAALQAELNFVNNYVTIINDEIPK